MGLLFAVCSDGRPARPSHRPERASNRASVATGFGSYGKDQISPSQRLTF